MATKKNNPQEEIEKKFQALKRRTEIKQRYGAFTQQMFEQLLEELRLRIREDIKQESNRLNDKLDWLITAYKRIDEEQILMSGHLSEHEERIYTVEQKLNIAN